MVKMRDLLLVFALLFAITGGAQVGLVETANAAEVAVVCDTGFEDAEDGSLSDAPLPPAEIRIVDLGSLRGSQTCTRLELPYWAQGPPLV